MLFFKYIIGFIESLFDSWIQFRFIPKKNLVGSNKTYHDHFEDTFILMQGGIVTEDDFTYSTLKLYRSLYPNLKIVLSTWENEDKKVIDKISNLGIDIIKNKIPDNPGKQNIYLQSITTCSGLNKYPECELALKCRTDQRVLSPSNWISFIRDSYKSSQINGNHFLTTNLNTFTSRPKIISDMFVFGSTKNLKMFFSFTPKDEIKIKNIDLRNEFNTDSPEAMFMSSYLIECNLYQNAKDNPSILNEINTFIDYRELDLFWFKYNRYVIKPYRKVDGINTNHISRLDN